MVERKSDTFDVTGSNPVSYKKQRALICGCGEIGRHARFRFWFARVRVQVPSSVLIAYYIQRRGLESCLMVNHRLAIYIITISAQRYLQSL